MNSRERIRKAINNMETDILPIDFGGTPVTGMHVSIVYKLRQLYGLDKKNTPVKVVEPYQMLGEIKDDLKKILGSDTVSIEGNTNFLGFKNEKWKEWELYDKTPVLVPGLFNTEKNKDGSIYQYVEGDKSFQPSVKMPYKGFFFDSVDRQKQIYEDKLDPNDNAEEFKLITDSDLEFLKNRAEGTYKNSDYSVIGMIASSGFGDSAYVTGTMLKDPKGIRSIEEWYISMYSRKNYIKKVFEKQCEIAIENYKKVFNVLNGKIDVVFISGTDFGMQNGLIISKELYGELFKPYHKKINSWIHNNTNCKTFIHTCGAIFNLIPDLIEAGFDILNPVQISANGMDPKKLKNEYGKDIVFWGGGVNTQKTLPFGKPEDVKDEVRELIDIFRVNGGFVYSAVHNIQANVPIENVVAMIEALQEYRD